MKKQITKLMIAGIFSLLTLSSFAQSEKPSKHALTSDQGYWVIESNVNSPLQHTVRFYTNDNLLIGRKDMSGVKLDARKRKVKMMLKQNLDASLLAWKQNTANPDQTAIVATK